MVDLIRFQHFNRYNELSHCFTTKHGGVSNGVFTSLNMAFSRGDENSHVVTNYERVTQELGIKTSDLVFSSQVHKDFIRRVEIEDKGKGIYKESDISEIDGLITNQRGIGLVTFYADCVPLYFYDPVLHVIGLSHAGWKGTVAHIGAKTLQKMKLEYGTNPSNVLIGIGPSIGGCCYEVSADVKKQFDLSFNDDIIAKVAKQVKDKFLIDLWEANRLSLIEAGIKPENIEISNLCTKCHQDRFFSHRVMGNDRGSQVAIMALKPEVK